MALLTIMGGTLAAICVIVGAISIVKVVYWGLTIQPNSK